MDTHSQNPRHGFNYGYACFIFQFMILSQEYSMQRISTPPPLLPPFLKIIVPAPYFSHNFGNFYAVSSLLEKEVLLS